MEWIAWTCGIYYDASDLMFCEEHETPTDKGSIIQ